MVVEIPRGHPQLDYSAPAGQWVPRGAVLRCLIDENPEGEPVIYIEDHALSLQEFGGLLGTYAGWGMRIVFVEEDNSDPPLIEIRDLETGRRLTIGADPGRLALGSFDVGIRTGSAVSVPSPMRVLYLRPKIA